MKSCCGLQEILGQPFAKKTVKKLKNQILKNIYLSILLLLSAANYAQVVFETSLSEAFKKAKDQNKPVFIEYYNSDCSVCKRLGGLLREDATISAYYNAHFINYAMNTYDVLPKEDDALLKNANLHFESVPVLLFFDKDKKFLHYSSGDINSQSVMNEAKKAVFPEYNSAGLKAKYQAGDRSVRTLYAYCNLLVITKDDEKLKKVAQDLFESFDKSDLPTKKSYLILKRVVKTSDNGFFQYWINNLDKLKGFEPVANEGTEKSYLTKIVLTELSSPDVKKWDVAKKNRYKEYITKLQITDEPNEFFDF